MALATHGFNIDHNRFSEWLYGDWNEDKFRQFELLYSIPVVSSYMDYLLDHRASQEYLKRYGMDYTDIHDPRKLRESRSGAAFYRSSYSFISSNVNRLYR